MAKDLRGFLDQLRTLEGELLEIKRPIRPHQFEVTALLKQLHDRDRRAAVHFTSPTDLYGAPSDFSVLSNSYATRARCALMLGLDPSRPNAELSQAYADRAQRNVEPDIVPSGAAPVQQHVWQGEQADVGRLPIVRHYEKDLGPVLTMAHIMKSSEGFYDISFAKTFYKGEPRHMVVDIHTRDLGRIVAEYARRGQPAPIVNVLGHHPAFYLAALAPQPWGNNDYRTIGSLMGEPLRLTSSVTWGERFLVPADAEIIIEGEIPPGQLDGCDPFGEIAGLYQAPSQRPVFEVKAITARGHAVMQDIFSGFPEGWIVGAVPKEGGFLAQLQARFPNVQAAHLPDSGCGRFVCYLLLRDPQPGEALQVGREALEQDAALQCVVVVEPPIDIFREAEVLWAVQTYADLEHGVAVHRDLPKAIFVTAWKGRKVVIDATRPRDPSFPERLDVPKEALERVKLDEWLL